MQAAPDSRPGSRSCWRFLLGAILVPSLLLALFHGALIDWVSGHSQRGALTGAGLSPAAQELIDQHMAGMPAGQLLDLHAHLAGRGKGSDCWVNPRMLSLAHPKDWIRFRCYLSAAGLGTEDHDSAFVEDLLGLARAFPRPFRQYLLAFDYRYTREGQLDLEHSEFYVPNDYVFEVAAGQPDLFRPAASVHPYRKDALEELERCAARGARLIKWLPSAQGMDPQDPLCQPFFDLMARLDLILLVHCGEEQAVEAEAYQELGNPLRIRRALDSGVRVVVAHCASMGTSLDLDHPETPKVSSFELFLRLMEAPEYEGLLYGEISTVTQRNRFPEVLETLLDRTDLHPRLLNGSDWPLPGINILYQVRTLQRAGFLTARERDLLVEIYHHNPLTFDWMLKRCVRSPEGKQGFATEVFLGREGLGL